MSCLFSQLDLLKSSCHTETTMNTAPSATPNFYSTDPDVVGAPFNQGPTASGYSGPATPAPTSQPEGNQPPAASEALEDQNIFFMLGVTEGTEAEKEQFLDELQQVIWEDFLEYDVKLLITSDEMEEFQHLVADKNPHDLEQQEKIVVFLEKLIPDLEEIMLEKALQLKAEMVQERLAGLREYFAGQEAPLQSLDQAERLMQEEKWYSAAQLMNSLY